MWYVGDTKGQVIRCVEQYVAGLVVGGFDSSQPLGNELNIRIVGSKIEEGMPITKANDTSNDGPVVFPGFHLMHEK